jgi:hypothetical protein
MLVACQLAGLSALGAHYADLNALAQFGPTLGSFRVECSSFVDRPIYPRPR